jgi:hypothetical protein
VHRAAFWPQARHAHEFQENDMAEIRETHVERDPDGRVVDTKVTIDRPKRKGGGFGWGLLLGVLVIAVGLITFAYSQGSFQQAGARADQATAQVEQQSQTVAENAGDTLESAGDAAENATN